MIAYDQFVVVGSERSYRVLKVSRTPVFMHKTKFSFKNAIGLPYGACFEVKQGELYPLPFSATTSLDDSREKFENEAVEDVDNRQDDSNKISLADVQKLKAHDVKSLKDEGTHHLQLIAELAKNNKNFEHRTAFSQQKYVAKKKKKHSNTVCLLKPTIRLLAHIYYHKDTDKICGMRVDNLAAILSYSNVHCGSMALVVECCAGLITAGVLERLAGQGACIHFHRNDQAQAVPALDALCLSESEMSAFYPVSFHVLFGKKEEPQTEQTSNEQQNSGQEDAGREIKENEIARTASKRRKSSSVGSIDGEKDDTNTFSKRKLDRRREALRGVRQKALKIFHESKFDSLILAPKQHPLDFLKVLAPKMQPSSPLVIYSMHARLLIDCYIWLREQDIAINLKLSENFYRVHQVLPGRTHPEMNQLVVGGFLLTGIFVEN